mmetsp:Transcript_43714/g.110228  ORF Transcript_43714/g.110228 Transcript_43714/m.110228 type:complete len:310 (+) Transcript_43714:329-1258(+)
MVGEDDKARNKSAGRVQDGDHKQHRGYELRPCPEVCQGGQEGGRSEQRGACARGQVVKRQYVIQRVARVPFLAGLQARKGEVDDEDLEDDGCGGQRYGLRGPPELGFDASVPWICSRCPGQRIHRKHLGRVKKNGPKQQRAHQRVANIGDEGVAVVQGHNKQPRSDGGWECLVAQGEAKQAQPARSKQQGSPPRTIGQEEQGEGARLGKGHGERVWKDTLGCVVWAKVGQAGGPVGEQDAAQENAEEGERALVHAQHLQQPVLAKKHAQEAAGRRVLICIHANVSRVHMGSGRVHRLGCASHGGSRGNR